MSNSLESIIAAFDRLRQPHLFLWWDKWIPDVSWATYLSGKEGGLSQSITHDEFNYAMKRIEPYKTILFSEQNDLGIYCHQKKVNNRKVSFYYVSHDETIVPIRSNDIDDWKDFLKNNRISHIILGKELRWQAKRQEIHRAIPLGRLLLGLSHL